MRPRQLHAGDLFHFVGSTGEHASFQLLDAAKRYALAVVDFKDGHPTRFLTIAALEAHKPAILRLAKKHLARSAPQRFTKQ